MTKTMRWMCAVVVAAGLTASAGLHAAGAGAQAAGAKPAASAVARGKYLVTLGGCNDCHTPLKMGPNGPEPDTARLLSGHPAAQTMPAPPALQGGWMAATNMTAWAGPWGLSYSRNLTPDKETGLGEWTEQQFIETLRNGRHQGRGRQLLPPMPWQNLAQMTDADLKAVFAYLKTVPAVSNKVPEPVIATQ